MLVAGVSGPAVSATESVANDENIKTLEIDMRGYAPDKSEWSEKASTGYEQKKNSGGPPIALLTIGRLNLEAPVYSGTHRTMLDRGLDWVEGTASIDEVGNIGISGHRDGFFRPLKDIKVGDAIEMQTAAGVQNFEVSDISIVNALEVSADSSGRVWIGPRKVRPRDLNRGDEIGIYLSVDKFTEEKFNEIALVTADEVDVEVVTVEVEEVEALPTTG